jgi:XRE family transcriptional regulator, regulator of sulfur utilization
MITRRDLLIMVAAAGLTAGAFALADKPDVLGSTTFDWNSIPAKTTEVGSVRQVVSKPTATLENLEVHITTLNPGKSPHPPHRHPNEEMLIIRQGTLEALINGEWKRVGPGSVIFFASNQLHGVRNVGDDPAIYHVVNWKTAATPEAAHP